MKAFILTEGGSTIGFGHITRCLSLYQALCEKNIDVNVIIHGDQSVSVLLDNIQYKIIDWVNDRNSIISLINKSDLIIIDSMIAPTSLLIDLAKYTKLIAYIDDSRRITCNATNAVIIDWTPFVEKAYENIKNKNCEYLLGCFYISLRRNFWDVPEKQIEKQVSEVLVTMGGGDIRSLSSLILTALLKELSNDIKKTVIVGRGFTEKDITILKAFTNKNINLIFYPGELEIKNAFTAADIVISAGGQTLYELARLGVPTIAIEVIDNQRLDIEGWHNAGFIEYAGSWDDKEMLNNLTFLLNKLIIDPDLRLQKAAIGKTNVDGQGARRIVEHLIRRINVFRF